MSTALVEFEPGIIYNPRMGVDGAEHRLMAGVDYSVACAMRKATPNGYDVIPSENGGFSLKLDAKAFGLFGGQAKVLNDQVSPDSICIQHASAAVADVHSWEWAKLLVQGGEFDGIACMGVKHDPPQAVLVLIDL